MMKIIGLILIVVSLWQYTKIHHLLTHSQRAQGEVIEVAHIEAGEGDQLENDEGTVYRVAYQTHEGEEVVFVNPVSHLKSQYKQGQSVTVIYDPREPSKAMIAGFWQTYGVPLIFFLGGLLAIVMGFRSDH